jgi:autotransporter-associated beta strand protein
MLVQFLGVIANYSSLVVSNGATLDMFGRSPMKNRRYEFAGAGVGSTGALVNGSGTAGSFTSVIALLSDVTIGGAGEIRLYGPVTGDYGIIKVSANQLTLASNNTYTGSTIVKEGKVATSLESGLGAVPGSPTANNIQLDGGTLYLNPPANGDDLKLNANRGINLTANNGTIEVGPSRTGTVNGVISGSGRLTKTGSGFLLLNGANTYAGGLTIGGANLVRFTNDNAVGSVPGAPAVSLSNGIGWAGILVEDTTTLNANRIVALGERTQISVASGKTLTIDGKIIGMGGVDGGGPGGCIYINDVAGTNLGTLVLKPGNEFGFSGGGIVSNRVAVNHGTLSISADSCVGLAPSAPTISLLLGNGQNGVKLIATDTFSFDSKRIISVGQNTVDVDVVSGKIVTVPGDIVRGSLGWGAFKKIGDGTLRVNGTVSNDVAIVEAGELGGNGTITAELTFKNGSTVGPGNSIGTLTVNNMSLEQGAEYDWEVDNTVPTSDFIKVTGALTLPTGAPGSVPVNVVNVGGGSGTFTVTLFEFGSLVGDVDSLLINVGASGYDVTTPTLGSGKITVDMKPIPEPMLAGAALLALALLHRR